MSDYKISDHKTSDIYKNDTQKYLWCEVML